MNEIFTAIDIAHMSHALELAEKACGMNHPNPLVGAVVADGERIIGSGFHVFEKVDHAERIAITKAGSQAKGATLYVNLEPCVHQARTPPCVDLIIQSGIKRVVFSINDTDPRVNGLGEKKLMDAGIIVDEGLLAERARELNRDYLKSKSTGLPWIVVKVATSLDGKIGIEGVRGVIFSCQESLKLVHKIRAWCDAIMVGANTVRVDDPLLTCRIDDYESIVIPEDDTLLYPKPASNKNPTRITLSRKLDIPLNSKIFDTTDAPTVIFCGNDADEKKIDDLCSKGVKVIPIDAENDSLDLENILRKLVEMKIMNVMVEGGGRLIGELFSRDLVDEIYLSISPFVFGENPSVSWIEYKLLEMIPETSGFKIKNVFKIGDDCLIRARKEISY